MNKLLFYNIMLLISIGFTSCGNDDDDAPALGANVQVTVKNIIGTVQPNTTVYLYKDKVVSGSTKSSDADKQAVTNANGIATFSLNFTELNIFESKTELSFAVFYKVGGAEFVAPGSTSVTVKRNDEKKIDLTIPI
jgi:hypothetical protein